MQGRTRIIATIVGFCFAVGLFKAPVRPSVDREGYWRDPSLWGLIAPDAFAQIRRYSIIKSIQRGTITLNNETSHTATITSVTQANSELHYMGQNGAGDLGTRYDQTAARLDFTNATTITANMGTANAGVTIPVGYEVIEYYSGVVNSVQRGTITGSGSTATITSVSTGKSHVNNLGASDTANSAFNNSYIQLGRLDLTNATTVTLSISGGYSHIIGYEVVEMK